MKVSIQFQYMPDEKCRPNDESDHNNPIEVEDGQFLPIPNVGDTVTYESYEYDYDATGHVILDSGRPVTVARKVKTRHYGYNEGVVWVNIVVVDVPQSEMSMRLKA